MTKTDSMLLTEAVFQYLGNRGKRMAQVIREGAAGTLLDDGELRLYLLDLSQNLLFEAFGKDVGEEDILQAIKTMGNLLIEEVEPHLAGRPLLEVTILANLLIVRVLTLIFQEQQADQGEPIFVIDPTFPAN